MAWRASDTGVLPDPCSPTEDGCQLEASEQRIGQEKVSIPQTWQQRCGPPLPLRRGRAGRWAAPAMANPLVFQFVFLCMQP